ncbi:MAG: TrkH family potassium uptake protein [Acidimicrobiia bacterium]|nr:TrkH family potassium uptake protein [Acidimicrobiia bacterium]
MSIRRLLRVIGAVVAAIGVAMLLPVVVALIYQEFGDAWQLALAAATTVGFGGWAWQFGRSDTAQLTAREGFAIVGLSWIAMTFFGTLPYLFSGAITDFSDAFFETAAGFSTTGASIVPDPGELAKGILLWRAFTQWIGGMGIIVLSIAILPLLGVGGVELARAESPGPTPDRLTPRFRETAKRLWLVYAAFTAIEAMLLWLGDMTLFEAIAHSFTTMSTGGFSTDGQSMAAFSPYSQWVVIVFMFIAGASFALHFRSIARPKDYLRNAEFRLYGGIIIVATIVAAIGTWSGAMIDILRDSLFTITSLVTTTGYGTADFGVWPAALQIMVLGLMFVGGMAGSTGGSMKPYRLGVLYQASKADLRRVIHPKGVFPVRLGRDVVPDHIVESVQSFFLLYMFIFMTGTLAFGIINDVAGAGFDLVTSASAVASSVGNVGPGLAAVGPTSNYALVPDAGKWLLSFLMIVGRLEIFPVILLFTRELWRR